MRLKERGDDSPMLVERLVELVQDAPVMIGKESLVRSRGRIGRDALGEKEDKLLGQAFRGEAGPTASLANSG
jgi:hypothetical protein